MDIARLVTCNAVYLLPGWEKPCAAKVGHGLALGLGFQVIRAQEGWPMGQIILNKAQVLEEGVVWLRDCPVAWMAREQSCQS